MVRAAAMATGDTISASDKNRTNTRPKYRRYNTGEMTSKLPASAVGSRAAASLLPKMSIDRLLNREASALSGSKGSSG